VFFIDTEHFLASNRQEQLWRGPNSKGFPDDDDEL